MSKYNLIDNVTAGFSPSSSMALGGWTAVSNASLSSTAGRSFFGNQSLLLTHTGLTGTTASISSAPSTGRPIADPSTQYRCSAWLYHELSLREAHLGVEFFDVTGTSLGVTYSSVKVGDRSSDVTTAQGWTLATHSVTSPVNAYFAVVRIELRNLVATPFDSTLWIDGVVLTPYDYVASPTVEKMKLWLPEYMVEEDADQVNPTEPMARFLDLVGDHLNEVNELIDDFDYVSVADGGDPSDSSTLVDASGYPNSGTKAEWLPWISQLTGATRLNLEGGLTPWYYLEQNFPTWTDWETQINSAAQSPAVNLSLRERTDGLTTLTTASAHGVVAGDVVTVATSPSTNFNGYYEVVGIAGNTLTYSQNYGILAATRAASSTTATILCSRPHGFSVGESVVITGVPNADISGTRTIASVLQVGDDGGNNAFTITTTSSTAFAAFTGNVRPANISSTASTGTVTKASDLTWRHVEQVSPQNLSPNEVNASLIQSGASGIWSGTLEGIRRAARISLSGVDMSVQISASGGTATVACTVPHGLSVGDFVEIYRSSTSWINHTYVVQSVPSATTFTVSVLNRKLETTAWATNKKVTVTPKIWRSSISRIVVASGTMTITLTRLVPSSSLSGTVVITGTGNGSIDVTHSPGSITVSQDRKTISFSTGIGAVTIDPVSTSARLQVSGSSFCLLVSTKSGQTNSDDQVITFASAAKPAGAVISHAYLP